MKPLPSFETNDGFVLDLQKLIRNLFFLQTSHISPNKHSVIFLYMEKSCKQFEHKHVIQK